MIKIERYDHDNGETRWRASVHVRNDIGITNGRASPEGPWAFGFGPSPEDAVCDMYSYIGRAYVASLPTDEEIEGAGTR